MTCLDNCTPMQNTCTSYESWCRALPGDINFDFLILADFFQGMLDTIDQLTQLWCSYICALTKFQTAMHIHSETGLSV